MEIKFEKIVLRDMVESDIEDYVRWFTTETEWMNTDAPWEKEDSDAETERRSWTEYYESVSTLPEDVRRWKFEIAWNGRHIGWVSSYMIDEKFQWIAADTIQPGQTVYCAIGIDICEPDVWGNGIGTNALRAFMGYYFEHGVDELYTQTWSGNARMLRCAEKLGFEECNRYVGIRQVAGKAYDGLTFRLDTEKFHAFDTAQINRKFMRLCGGFDVPVQISTITDVDAPKFQISEDIEVPVITLNAMKILSAEYEVYAGYCTRRVLLPKLRLETDRLLLRRYRPQDAEQCFVFLSNEQDAYMDCCKAFHSMNAEYHAQVALFGQRETQYMITLKESGEVIGTVNVFADDSRAVDAMEIGYSIAHAHQRKGYAFEALFALLELLQNALGLEMVTAGILQENVASEKLLTKLGFHKEGLRHKAVWHEGLDKPVDLLYFYRDSQENAT